MPALLLLAFAAVEFGLFWLMENHPFWVVYGLTAGLGALLVAVAYKISCGLLDA